MLCAPCVLWCVRRVGAWPVGLVLFVCELRAAAYDVCSVVCVCVRRVRRSLRTGEVRFVPQWWVSVVHPGGGVSLRICAVRAVVMVA